MELTKEQQALIKQEAEEYTNELTELDESRSCGAIYQDGMTEVLTNPDKYFPDQNTVYEFIYNECVHEGGAVTFSIHKTKEGAEKALKKHKAMCRRNFNKLYKDEEPPFKFEKMQYWDVIKTKIKD